MMMEGLFLPGRCMLCGWPILGLGGPARGRCLGCLSTAIHRAVGQVVAGLGLPATARVYELSSRGALVRFLRRSFRDVYLSEYLDGVPPGTLRRGVPCQDVQALRLADASFDLVTSTEVFEHVPDDGRGFAEVWRVLRPGGRFVFTVPLLPEGVPTLERARLGPAGEIVHLAAPEYHSDRLRGAGRVLAFRTYGRDICQRLARVGFDATILAVADPAAGSAGRPVIVAGKGAAP